MCFITVELRYVSIVFTHQARQSRKGQLTQHNVLANVVELRWAMSVSAKTFNLSEKVKWSERNVRSGETEINELNVRGFSYTPKYKPNVMILWLEVSHNAENWKLFFSASLSCERQNKWKLWNSFVHHRKIRHTEQQRRRLNVEKSETWNGQKWN